MEKRNILLVEGPNDRNAIIALMERYGVNPNFETVVCHGLQQLLQSMDGYLKNATAYGIIGIVVDADTDVNARWQQMRDRLMKTGKYACKKVPLNENGIIVEAIESDLDARVGFWIMPDNKYQGTLENFLLQMVQKDDDLLTEVERELSHIENENLKRYRDIDRNKAKIHTFLSWEKNPGCSIKTAISSYVLNPNVPIANIFIEWLKKLFFSPVG